MRNLILILIFATSSLYARKVAQHYESDNEIQIHNSYKAPLEGPYFKTAPYHVTSDRYSPQSEEILFFLLTEEFGKLTSIKNYLHFHSYFKREQKKLIKLNPYGVIGPEKLYPLIYKYVKSKGFSISKKEFKEFVLKKEETIKKIKFIFATKANASYFTYTPKEAKATLGEHNNMPLVEVRLNNKKLRQIIVARKVYHFKNREDEKQFNLKKADEIKPELTHIHNSLPDKSLVKQLLKTFI